MSDASAVAMVQSLLARLAERDARIAVLEVQVASMALMETMIKELTTKVTTLESQLKRNSSKPQAPTRSSSRCPGRCARPRAASPANRPGSRAYAWNRSKTPDAVLIHEPGTCASCGLDLAGAPITAERYRQVFDLPSIALEVTAHLARTRACSCGHATEALSRPCGRDVDALQDVTEIRQRNTDLIYRCMALLWCGICGLSLACASAGSPVRVWYFRRI